MGRFVPFWQGTSFKKCHPYFFRLIYPGGYSKLTMKGRLRFPTLLQCAGGDVHDTCCRNFQRGEKRLEEEQLGHRMKKQKTKQNGTSCGRKGGRFLAGFLGGFIFQWVKFRYIHTYIYIIVSCFKMG